MSSNRPQRAERGPSGPLFFALIFLVFSTVPAFAADPILNWIKSPEAYFATPEELAKWKAEVVSAADAQKFIDEYWHRRGENFRKEVRTRLEFADLKFGLGKIPGSRTAMGEVFMIFGAPNEQKTTRGGTMLAPSAAANPMAGRMQDSPIEQGALVTNTWIYKKDRLPAALGIGELKVDFVTDVSRSRQTIDNPGNVMPYLRKAASALSAKAMLNTTTPSPQIARPTAPSTSDPLWNATPNLNGAIFTGEAFVSPREAPFYAVSFYLPKDAAAFSEWKTSLLVALIRDASGNQVVSERQQVELNPYDDAGNRYVDRSFALAPGKYDAILALYSPDGTTMLASHREQFEVASATAARASKLFLTSHVDTLETQDPLDPFTFVGQKYAIRGDRRFRASDRISLFTIIANPAGSPSPQLMQKLTFSRDGKTFAKMPLEPSQLTQTGPNTFLIGAAFDPGSFKPGHYMVEVQVRDFNAPEGSELRTKGYVLTTEFDIQ